MRQICIVQKNWICLLKKKADLCSRRECSSPPSPVRLPRNISMPDVPGRRRYQKSSTGLLLLQRSIMRMINGKVTYCLCDKPLVRCHRSASRLAVCHLPSGNHSSVKTVCFRKSHDMRKADLDEVPSGPDASDYSASGSCSAPPSPIK